MVVVESEMVVVESEMVVVEPGMVVFKSVIDVAESVRAIVKLYIYIYIYLEGNQNNQIIITCYEIYRVFVMHQKFIVYKIF